MFLRFVSVVPVPGVGAFTWLYDIPWREDITVCWFVLLVNIWVVSRALAISVAGNMLGDGTVTQKGIEEFRTDLGGGETQSGTCTRLD